MSEKLFGIILGSTLVLGLIVAGIMLILNKIPERDKREECRALGIFMFIIAAFALASCIPVFLMEK